MCFSAESSFVSGAVVGGVGVATLTLIRHWREVVLGVLPLLFALHQVEEGMVWLALEGRVSPLVGRWCVWLYILFAHALLTAIVPWSLWLAEPDRKHRRWLVPLLVLGTGLCGFALWGLFDARIVARIHHHGIEYDDPLTGPWWFAVLYIAATCTPPFLSSYRWMIAFGALNLAGLIAASLFKSMYFTSIWCAAAALVSVLVYLHFRRVRGLSAIPFGRSGP